MADGSGHIPDPTQKDRAPATLHQPTQVLIVDDHEVVRYGLTQLLSNEKDLEVCGAAGSVSRALELVREKKPQLVIVDISLKDGNGLELIKDIRAYDPSVQIIVLSMFDDKFHVERALRAGAQGYVSKQEPAGTILVAVHRILEGGVFLSEQMTEHFLRLIINSKDGADSPVESLSNRELQIFEMIGQGRTVKQIAEALNISGKTVEYHRAHIKEKLEMRTATELVRYAVAWLLERR